MVTFPISGVETYWWLPVLVAFVVSLVTSTGGVSGAFILLPYQVSILGFTGPAVSPTNLVFNIVAIPSGVWRYWREGRIVWPLAWLIVIGTLPGIFAGAMIRIKYLPNPRSFKLFAACVLIYIAVRMVLAHSRYKTDKTQQPSDKFTVSDASFSLRALSYNFDGQTYSIPTLRIVILCVIVGVIGGTYGIGGGAIIAPFLISMFRLPVHSIAGATLFGTFATSVAGVAFYWILGGYYSGSEVAIIPDWQLGLLFGVGGALGMYTGAHIQRFVPAKTIKILLVACLLFIAGGYVIGFFRG